MVLPEVIERVNLGSGEFPIEGWLNVDAYTDADVQEDVFGCTFHGLREVRMDHFLEHVTWLRTAELLKEVRRWMALGGLLTIEVPDMSEIMRRSDSDSLCWAYIYGSQQHEGEYHRAGFTERSLHQVLGETGWENIKTRTFLSGHPNRMGMPCLWAQATA